MKIWRILSADIWRVFKRDLSKTNYIFLADLVDLGFALSFNNRMAPCTQRGEVLSYISLSIIIIIFITRSRFHVPGTRSIFHSSKLVFMVFHGCSWFQVGFRGFSLFQVGFHGIIMVQGWFCMAFHGSRWVFMLFHGSRLVFHGSRYVFMFFS